MELEFDINSKFLNKICETDYLIIPLWRTVVSYMFHGVSMDIKDLKFDKKPILTKHIRYHNNKIYFCDLCKFYSIDILNENKINVITGSYIIDYALCDDEIYILDNKNVISVLDTKSLNTIRKIEIKLENPLISHITVDNTFLYLISRKNCAIHTYDRKTDDYLREKYFFPYSYNMYFIFDDNPHAHLLSDKIINEIFKHDRIYPVLKNFYGGRKVNISDYVYHLSHGRKIIDIYDIQNMENQIGMIKITDDIKDFHCSNKTILLYKSLENGFTLLGLF